MEDLRKQIIDKLNLKYVHCPHNNFEHYPFFNLDPLHDIFIKHNGGIDWHYPHIAFLGTMIKVYLQDNLIRVYPKYHIRSGSFQQGEYSSEICGWGYNKYNDYTFLEFLENFDTILQECDDIYGFSDEFWNQKSYFSKFINWSHWYEKNHKEFRDKFDEFIKQFGSWI